MNQQINLFLQLPRLKVETGRYTIKNMVLASIAMVALSLVYAVYINWKAHRLNNEVETLTEDKKIVQQAYDDTSKKYPAEAKAAIANQDKDIEQHIAVKKALLNLLQSSSLGTEGFASKLEGLSEDIQAGMWLTSIEFNLTNHYIGFSGVSTSVEILLRFIDKLGQDPAFAGEKFATLRMDKPQTSAQSEAFSFILSNHTAHEPAAAVVPALEAKPSAPSAPSKAVNVNMNNSPAAEKPPKAIVMPGHEEASTDDASEQQQGEE